MRAALLAFSLPCLLVADDAALIRSSLAKLQKDPQAARADLEVDSPVDRAAMRMPLSGPGAPWRAKYLAAEWLLQAHLLRSRAQPVPAVTRERLDLEQAWKLLFIAQEESRRTIVGTSGSNLYRGSDPTARVMAAQALSNSVGQEKVPAAFTEAMQTLALEIAVRLEDPSRMILALEPVLAHPALRPRDKTFALVAAVHGGRWEAARSLCQQLSGTPGFQSLHDRALSQADAFDYTVFDTLAPEPPPAMPAVLATSTSKVGALRLRLSSAEGDPALSAKVREAYPPGWHAPEPQGSALVRRGAAARWAAPGDPFLPLTGLSSSERLFLRGYEDQPEGRRVDTLDLRPDASRPGRWVGRLSSQYPGPSGGALFQFEVELELL
jgi:hypothetical protein